MEDQIAGDEGLETQVTTATQLTDDGMENATCKVQEEEQDDDENEDEEGSELI